IDYFLNWSLRWNNNGYSVAGGEYLLWIKWKLRKGLLLKKGKLIAVTFRNMIAASQSQNDAEEVKNVITDFSSFLSADDYETNISFANGIYHYERGDYKLASRFFLMAQPKEDPVFNCLVRYWHWKALYEDDSDDIDSLINQLLTFERYIQRTKAPINSKLKTFEKFIYYAGFLINGADKHSKTIIKSRIKAEGQFAGKSWLFKQFGM
ncbi:MAG TPA: hypothetical protein PLW44_13795, partial [Chitinophagales bacterium]|nr:hypothetical protein [Chitinophagales bacterium]